MCGYRRTVHALRWRLLLRWRKRSSDRLSLRIFKSARRVEPRKLRCVQLRGRLLLFDWQHDILLGHLGLMHGLPLGLILYRQRRWRSQLFVRPRLCVDRTRLIFV